MNTFQLRDASEVALAAYGQFSAIENPLIDSLGVLNGDDSGFATSQAIRFGTRCSVAIPTFNDVSSPGGSGKTSFDATVFIGQDTPALTGNANQICIAMRGTQQKFDEVNDLLGASAKILRNTGSGLSFCQAVSLRTRPFAHSPLSLHLSNHPAHPRHRQPQLPRNRAHREAVFAVGRVHGLSAIRVLCQARGQADRSHALCAGHLGC
jgi:hypothetical protein